MQISSINMNENNAKTIHKRSSRWCSLHTHCMEKVILRSPIVGSLKEIRVDHTKFFYKWLLKLIHSKPRRSLEVSPLSVRVCMCV